MNGVSYNARVYKNEIYHSAAVASYRAVNGRRTDMGACLDTRECVA